MEKHFAAAASACLITLFVATTALAQEAADTGSGAYAKKPILTDSGFNPAISVILDGKYRHINKDPDTWAIGGFIPGGEELGPGERGFGIDESELTFSGNIDPYFSGYFTAAVTPEDEVEVEEAYIQTVGLAPGFTVKFGRYLTAFGYQNEQHAHVWDFADLPLIHQAFLGGQYSDDGVQLRYVFPTPVFLEVGGEFGKGSAFPGSDRAKNGSNAGGVFLRLGGDVGLSNSYRLGVSYRQTRAKDREYADLESTGVDVTNAFTGRSKLWALDAVWKWAPGGDGASRNLKLQAEYFQRKETGDLVFDTADARALGSPSGGYESKQKGFYTQAIFQFAPRWRVGARYDRLDSGTPSIGLVSAGTLTAADFPKLAEHTPQRTTLMVDFSPSEFSRFRLQFARDEARFAEKDNQILFQYIMSLGAHGAHKF